MNAKSREEAWEIANQLFTTDYEKDAAASERAGYDIYRHAWMMGAWRYILP